MDATSPTTERRLTIVWLGLSAITLLSWWLGSKHGPDAFVPNAGVTIGVMAMALVKVRFIMRDFMELRHAPVAIRRLGDAWLALMTLALFGLYFAPALIGRAV